MTTDDDEYRDMMEVLEPTRLWDMKFCRVGKSFYPEYKQQLVDLMYHGHTFPGACGRMGIVYSTGLAWLKKFPDWAEAKEIGEQCRLAKLEIALNKSATGSTHPGDEDYGDEKGLIGGDLRAIMFSLKAVHRHQYAEKVITESTESETDANKSEEDLDAQISRQLATIRDSITTGQGAPAKARAPKLTGKKKKPRS